LRKGSQERQAALPKQHTAYKLDATDATDAAFGSWDPDERVAAIKNNLGCFH
jgi:hypothetical protein